MNTIIKFEGDDLAMLRATLSCAANAKDVRYYLQGIYLCADHVVGTSGAKIAAFPMPAVESGGWIDADDISADLSCIVPTFKIAASIRSLTISIDWDNKTASIEPWDRKDKRPTIILSLIDGTYPNYKRVMPNSGYYGNHLDYGSVIFNPSLVADVQKVLKSESITMHPNQEQGGNMKCEFKGYPDLIFHVMPCRF